ncbi:hypothetical protein chiPu_0027530, partial [Chiloscyllium punctatum]|nr:hypothetical protein [Chiloscyllium punctatum]
TGRVSKEKPEPDFAAYCSSSIHVGRSDRERGEGVAQKGPDRNGNTGMGTPASEPGGPPTHPRFTRNSLVDDDL